jgi:hypothetical protein
MFFPGLLTPPSPSSLIKLTFSSSFSISSTLSPNRLFCFFSINFIYKARLTAPALCCIQFFRRAKILDFWISSRCFPLLGIISLLNVHRYRIQKNTNSNSCFCSSSSICNFCVKRIISARNCS